MSEMLAPSDDADAIVVAVSDFLDGLGAEDWRADVAQKIERDPAWRAVHAEMIESRAAKDALSGLQKARAPDSFAQDVTAAIAKRSAGRFFGRRTFGDRVPFGALAIAALVAILAIGYLLWSSGDGSLDRQHERAPHPDPVPVTPPT